MPKPTNKEFNLKEKLLLIKKSGNNIPIVNTEIDELANLTDRIKLILGIIQSAPKKNLNMNVLILYDIESNKVRRLIAKFLLSKGCARIQKSVYMVNTTAANFNDIYEVLKDINEFYDNQDSIMLVPVNVTDVRSMKLIGNNVNIDLIANPPNTLFF
jgi:CRISPR-associated endonuclease Cas2